MGNVVHQGAERGLARDRDWLVSPRQDSRVDSCQHPGGNRLGVAFDAGDLAGEQEGGFGCADSLRMFLG